MSRSSHTRQSSMSLKTTSLVRGRTNAVDSPKRRLPPEMTSVPNEPDTAPAARQTRVATRPSRAPPSLVVPLKPGVQKKVGVLRKRWILWSMNIQLCFFSRLLSQLNVLVNHNPPMLKRKDQSRLCNQEKLQVNIFSEWNLALSKLFAFIFKGARASDSYDWIEYLANKLKTSPFMYWHTTKSSCDERRVEQWPDEQSPNKQLMRHHQGNWCATGCWLVTVYWKELITKMSISKSRNGQWAQQTNKARHFTPNRCPIVPWNEGEEEGGNWSLPASEFFSLSWFF
jgi:hypothetical protein